jgi:Ricin-type beta-trefoil lectin domain-like
MQNNLHMTLSLTLAIATAAVLSVAPPARAEDNIVKLVSSANGKCLQPINGSHNQGDAIVQETCNGSAAQQWTVHQVSSTKVHLINRASGLCLDARGKAVSGTPIQQWTCNNISNENWGFGITNNLLVSAVSNTWSHCIATPGNQDGLAMELRPCSNPDSSRIWTHPND